MVDGVPPVIPTIMDGISTPEDARTSDAAWIIGYLGGRTVFDKASRDFAVAYADQTEQDYQLLAEAVNIDRIQAETGV